MSVELLSYDLLLVREEWAAVSAERAAVFNLDGCVHTGDVTNPEMEAILGEGIEKGFGAQIEVFHPHHFAVFACCYLHCGVCAGKASKILAIFICTFGFQSLHDRVSNPSWIEEKKGRDRD